MNSTNYKTLWGDHLMSNLVKLFVVFMAALSLTSGCGQTDGTSNPSRKGQIEVAPGLFVVVEDRSPITHEPPPMLKALGHSLNLHCGKVSDTTEWLIQWQGTNVHWKGNAIPVALRAYEDKLYLIVWDRVTLGPTDGGVPRPQFRYYQQVGGELKEIANVAFPKAIAVQNIGFFGRYFMTDRQRDNIQIARDIDPEDAQFCRSMTAKIWCHLVTGKQDYESPYTIDASLLKAYIRSNQPPKLTFKNYFKTEPEEPTSSPRGTN